MTPDQQTAASILRWLADKKSEVETAARLAPAGTQEERLPAVRLGQGEYTRYWPED